MKKLFALLMTLTLALSFTACSGSGTTYKDGTYTASETEFQTSGWKDNITITVKDGKISDVNWNSVSQDETKSDKKTEAANGDYGMKERSEIGKEWDEQAKVVEDKLIETQDPAKINMTADGYADGISGCSINISGFVTLAKDALSTAK